MKRPAKRLSTRFERAGFAFAAAFFAVAAFGTETGTRTGTEAPRMPTANATATASNETSRPSVRAFVAFDDFETVDNWDFPIYQYGDVLSGDVEIANGELSITRKPRAKWHSVEARRTVRVRFEPGLAVFFRFRFEKRLLGSDFYFRLNVAGRNWVELGVNGEQSWRMFKRCKEKDFDDELFYGAPSIVGQAPNANFPDGKKTDIRAALGPATAGAVRWDDWRVIGVVWDGSGDSENGEFGRLRVFVDGDEIRYRDLDCVAPEGEIDRRFKPEVLSSQRERLSNVDRPDELEIVFSAFADGDLYSDENANGGAGVRWTSAFASTTPAIPSPDGPEFATPLDAVLRFDYLFAVDSACVEVGERQAFLQRLVEEKRLPKRALDALENAANARPTNDRRVSAAVRTTRNGERIDERKRSLKLYLPSSKSASRNKNSAAGSTPKLSRIRNVVKTNRPEPRR